MIFKIFLITFCLFLPFVIQGVSSININTALLEELEEIIGIGPVLAQRIIEARPFNSLDDLIKVKGIGETTLQKIKDQGLARVVSQEKLEPEPATSEENNPQSAKAGQEPKEENYELSLPTGDLPKEEIMNYEDHEPEKTTPIIYPSGIIFNEILPSPEGPDSENEWIEIYNQNDFKVDLSGWIIKDTIGSTKSYTLNTVIPSHGYLLLKRPETKITLNNDNDGLVFLNPNEETIDSASFGKASQNQSYSRTSSGWVWTTTLTPNSKNIITKNNKQRTVNNKQSLSEDELNTESAEVGPPQIKLVDDLEKSSKAPLFLIAFIVALLSSISFFIIKNNLKSFWY